MQKNRIFHLAAFLFIVSWPFAPLYAQGIQVFVSPHGQDAWTGQFPQAKPDQTDGPFATLERARDAVRKMERKPGEAIEVILGEGIYELPRTFELTEEDGGSADCPILYRNADNQQVILSGGRVVRAFQPVKEDSALQRLEESARQRVLQVNLTEQGVTDFGQLTPRGFGRSVQPAGLEVFYQDKPMTLARWPNEGWMTIADVPAGQNGGKFSYDGDRPNRWVNAKDVWLHGFWTQDWADSYVKVKEIKTDSREILTQEPHGIYGYTKGKRYYALNLLEELDAPGEWYLDRDSGVLYFWPPDGNPNPEVVVSTLESPLVRIKNASFIQLGKASASDTGLLILDGGRANGLEIEGGSRVAIKNAVIRNMGNVGVTVQGEECGVEGCEIYQTSDGGVQFSGGDRKTLIPGRNYALNNHIYDYSRWDLTYRPAVLMSGVGHHIAHNEIHNAPHTGILFSGNEHVIEYNEIYDVCYETGDVGAIYIGRDWTMRGNVIRYNYLHDITGPHTYGAMAVYLDDAASGTTIYGNVFVNASAAAFIGGGRDNKVENNLFVNCGPSVHIDARCTSWAEKYAVKDGEWHMYEKLADVNYTQPPYSEKYPQLAKILENEPQLPLGTVVKKNISFGGKWLRLQDQLEEKDIVKFEDNYVTDEAPAKDVKDILNWLEKEDSPKGKIGFERIPFGEMGRILHK